MTTTTTNALLDAALGYAARGWSVFPIHTIQDGRCNCGDPECLSPGKHPRTEHGLKDATTDQATIRRWWGKWTDANVAVVTGSRSDIFVVDVDPRHGGDEALTELEEHHGPLPNTVETITGGGGRHILFAHPGGDARIPNSSGKVGRGVDVRGDGGYVLVEPSRHASGRRYHFDVAHHPDDMKPAAAPAWLLDRVVEVPTSPAPTGAHHEVEKDKRVKLCLGELLDIRRPDNKDGSLRLYTAACRCVEHDLSDDQAVLAIRAYEVLRPFLRRWKDEEIISRVRDAEKKIERGSSLGGPTWPEPVDLADLEGNADPEFKVKGYVAVGHSTELVGFWKAGKTTLLAHWLRGFVGRANSIGVKRASVLMITEEHRNHWVRRCERHGLAGAKIIVRPFGGSKPSLRGWTSFIEHVAMIVERDGVEVVIFDTFTNLGPLEDENDAAQMTAALNPVNMITEAGAAVILVHHSRKGDGDQAQASRGSGALPGFVDVIVELRRFRPSDHDDTRRVLTAYGRFENTPPEVVFDLGEEGYVLLGTKQDVAKAGRMYNIAKLLSSGLDKALSVKEVGGRWEKQFGTEPPTEGSLRDDLRVGFKAGKWHRVGAGVKGDPHKYFNEEQEADG